MLAQLSETLAIAPSALGSTCRLIAKRRTPFSPRAHYTLGTCFWEPRYSRWPRPHELGLHDSIPAQPDATPSSLAIWLATRANVRAGLSCAPALGERRHRGLTRRLVAVCRRAILMIAKGQRPHPRRALRCRVHLHDAADDGTIGEHVEVVVVPLAGGTRGRCGGRAAVAPASVPLTRPASN